MGLRYPRRQYLFVLVVFIAVATLATAEPAVADQTKSAPELIPVDATQLLNLVREYDQGPVLVNLWATWCQPCREEMPDLLKLNDEHGGDGFQLILVSADFTRQKDKAAEFLGSLGVDFQTYLKNQTDNEFINLIDPQWSGALPFSILFAADGSVIRTWEGKLTYDEVDALLTQQ